MITILKEILVKVCNVESSFEILDHFYVGILISL